jgi:hypothetical protein
MPSTRAGPSLIGRTGSRTQLDRRHGCRSARPAQAQRIAANGACAARPFPPGVLTDAVDEHWRLQATQAVDRGESELWKGNLLEEILSSQAAPASIRDVLVLEGARVSHVLLGGLGGRSRDTDGNLLAHFVKAAGDRESQRACLEHAIGRAVRPCFETPEPVRRALQAVRVKAQPAGGKRQVGCRCCHPYHSPQPVCAVAWLPVGVRDVGWYPGSRTPSSREK